jgi:hypothetical protein
LKRLRLVAKKVRLPLTGAYLSPDSSFDSIHNRKCILNAAMIPNLKETFAIAKPPNVDGRFFHAAIYWAIKPLVIVQQERFVSEQPCRRRYVTEPFRYSSSPEVMRGRIG